MITNWIISLVPWWVWVIVAVVVLLAAWRILGTKGMLAAAGGLLLFFAYVAGGKQSLERERARQERERQKALKVKKDVEAEVENLSDDDVDSRLSKWMRDGR